LDKNRDSEIAREAARVVPKTIVQRESKAKNNYTCI